MDDIWGRAQAGHEDARSEVVQRYGLLVNYVVGQIRPGIPPWIDTEDLISYGNFGLMGAMQRFEPERGLQFTTYAVRKIRGAILDELRRIDWAPRQLRPDARAIATADEELTRALQRSPTPSELAAHLGWSQRRVDGVLADAEQSRTLSLDLVSEWDDNNEDERPPMDVPVRESVGEQAMAETEYGMMISRALSLLDPNERSLMAMYYFEGMRFSDIAKVVGVSESWICLIYAQAMDELRSLATL